MLVHILDLHPRTPIDLVPTRIPLSRTHEPTSAAREARGGRRVGAREGRPTTTDFAGGCHRRMQRGQIAHHAFVLVLLVGVDGLRVLP